MLDPLISEIHKFPGLYAVMLIGLIVMTYGLTMVWLDDHKTKDQDT